MDGLRAVAVLGVVLFHYRIIGFAGGYVGVDVFFVISGFLITGIIEEQFRAGSFSFRQFYLRRVRQILPMLFVTIIASIPFAAAFLPPRALKDFGSSAVAASLSASNVLFFKKVSYFDTEAILKPLLHTWSLGVEEQFYLIWPLGLVLLLKYVPRRAPIVIGIVGLISLASAFAFEAHPAALFYLTPFRVWEFALGAVLVWLPSWPGRDDNRFASLMSLCGLALILLAFFVPFGREGDPRHLAIACIGTALCIYAGKSKAGELALANPAAVALGKISYSVYLLHWPVLVFLPYLLRGPPGTPALLFAAAGVIGASALTWRFVEVPLRRARGPQPYLRPVALLSGCAAMLSIVSLVGVNMYATDGWLWRFPPAIQLQIRPGAIKADEVYTWKLFKQMEGRWDNDALPKVLIIGDSQAADFVNILASANRLTHANIRTIEASKECQPLLTFNDREFQQMDSADKAECRRAFNEFKSPQAFQDVRLAILAFQWDEHGLQHVQQAVAELHRRGIQKIVIVGRKSQGRGGPDLIMDHGLGPGLEAYSATMKNPDAAPATRHYERCMATSCFSTS